MAPRTCIPARTLDEATPALDPTEALPSGDPRWQDLNEGRGDEPLRRLRLKFERKEPSAFKHVAFASHRGAGKTTELNRLMSDLEARYRCVYLEADVELDANRFSIEDFLLVLARAIEAAMREDGTPLPSALLAGIEDWFAKTVVTEALGEKYLGEIKAGAKAKGGIPFFGELFASLTALCRAENEYREKVESILRKYPGTLTQAVNGLLDAARERLAETGRDLLVIADNMDRYSPDLMDALLVREADRFGKLRCNLIVTPPIGLVYQPPSQNIRTVFATEVMPTVRLRRRHDAHDQTWGPGRDVLLAALGKRIDLDELIPDEKARDRLVFASGGAIRELLDIACDVSLEAEGPALSLGSVESVLRRRRSWLHTIILSNGWADTLARIGAEKRLHDDARCQQVLFQRLAFEYNGETWYDVHPLVAEIPEMAARIAQYADAGGRTPAP